MTNTHRATHLTLPPRQWEFSVSLRLTPDGPEADREVVRESDLRDVYGEIWMASCLRKGFPDTRLSDLPIRCHPVFRNGGDGKCTGFDLEATSPDGQTTRLDFSIHALERVAIRASKRLIAANRLQPNDLYYYRLCAEAAGRGVASAPQPPSEAEPFATEVTSPPLAYLKRPVASLLSEAECVGPSDSDAFGVFFTRDAFAKVEEVSRSGAGLAPPVETGAVLLGPLVACPETGEFYAVVCDALALAGAQQTEYSLTYSGATWARIQALLCSMQARPATRAFRMLGQTHGHNFPLDALVGGQTGTKPLPFSSLSSAFLSADDREWTAAVLAGQPYQLALVFGQTAWGAKTHQLYGLRDGRLMERGYYLIPKFRVT